MPIRASVGHGGANQNGDVLFVQVLLNDWRVRNALPSIQVDGLIGPETIGAIKQFQTKTTGMVDGRIDPNGPAIKKLEECHLAGIMGGTWGPAIAPYASPNPLLPLAPDPELTRSLHLAYLQSLRDNFE